MSLMEAPQRKVDSQLLERVLRHIIKMFVKGDLIYRYQDQGTVTTQDLRPAAERLKSCRA